MLDCLGNKVQALLRCRKRSAAPSGFYETSLHIGHTQATERTKTRLTAAGTPARRSGSERDTIIKLKQTTKSGSRNFTNIPCSNQNMGCPPANSCDPLLLGCDGESGHDARLSWVKGVPPPFGAIALTH
jgi:hypothetical protein